MYVLMAVVCLNIDYINTEKKKFQKPWKKAHFVQLILGRGIEILRKFVKI